MLSAMSIKNTETQYLMKIILHTHTQNRLTMFVSCLQLKLLASNKRQWLCSPNTLWFQFHYAVVSWAIPWAINVFTTADNWKWEGGEVWGQILAPLIWKNDKNFTKSIYPLWTCVLIYKLRFSILGVLRLEIIYLSILTINSSYYSLLTNFLKDVNKQQLLKIIFKK